MKQQMKRIKAGAAKLIPMMVIAAAFSLLGTAPSWAGIENTKHNLSSTAPLGANSTASTTGVCVFCHTPHGSDATAAVPMWNRALPAAGTFTTYDALNTTTLDADVLAVGSVSLACLSCHDGSQALDAMINAPGSGGYNAGGLTQGWIFSDTNQLNDARITNIGKDLQDDHPVGVRFVGGDGATSGKLTELETGFAVASYNAAKDYWWVDTEATPNGTRNSTDLILYTRDFSGTTQPSVECASCHDPHAETTTFLRIANTGSALCQTCHNK